MHDEGRPALRHDAARDRGRSSRRGFPAGNERLDLLLAAVAQRLRTELPGAALNQWEADSGSFTEQELSVARAALAPRRRSRGA